jgi:thiol:disulfide interchange protein DsbD
MMKKLLTLVIMMSLCLCTYAQMPTPIKWHVSARMTSATEGVVRLKAVINQGWHLYGTEMPKGGPKATTIDFTDTGVKFKGTLTPSVKPVAKHDTQFDIDVTWWEGSVTFTRKFKNTGKASKISGSITYMGCNDQTCLPPKTEQFSVAITPYKEGKSK